ncbi:hypothetical protein [Streptomyces sp. NPDC047000]|uniref:helix-turn-helix transcriptional regulator n=1 Tax=Streptomyces sp. NPDC047000 TaxID=3155474 RepID=UPI0033E1504B
MLIDVMDAGSVPEHRLQESLGPLAARLADSEGTAEAAPDPARLIVRVALTPAPVPAADGAEPVALSRDHLIDALAAHHQIEREVTRVLGLPGPLPLLTLTIEGPWQRREAELSAGRDRDLVGIAEIAELRGVARQSAHRTTRLPDFPDPYADLAAGRIWRRHDVEEYFARRDRKARESKAPAGSAAPSLVYRLQIASMLADLRRQLPPDLATAAEHPHLLTGTTLARAVAELGGPAAICDRLSVSVRTVQRWIAGTDQPPA